MDDSDFRPDEHIASQIKGAVKNLRSELNAAFGDGSKSSGQSKKSANYIDEKSTRQLLKLTEYLLHLKEAQLAEAEAKNKALAGKADALADIALAVINKSATMDKIISAAAQSLCADSAVLWHQAGNSHEIKNYNIDNGRELFLSLLPLLSKNESSKVRFSEKGFHYLACSKDVAESVYAVLFIRNPEHKPFSDEDENAADGFSEILFTFTIKAD